MTFSPEQCQNKYGRRLRDILSDLHRHPELSMEEKRTTQIIRDTLTSIGVELIDLPAATGVIGKIAAPKGVSGPAIGLRADIDAINQHEKTERPDKSLSDGIMHGCGHDIHTVSLLGAAMLLAEEKEKLQGDVYFIFQPAEETLLGARYLIEDCSLWDQVRIDALFGLHNDPESFIGTVGLKNGPLMSYKDGFSLRFLGRGGHGSRPEKNIDPIVAAASFIQSAQTIISRNVSPFQSAVLSICQLHAGTPANLIVDDVLIAGDIRTLDASTRDRVLARFREIAEGTAAAYECTCELDMHSIVPGVCNPDTLYPVATAAAAAVFTDERIYEPHVNLASEDFAVYARFVPAFFYFLGSGAKDRPVRPWHDACFYPDQDTPLYGAALLAQSVITAERLLLKEN